MRHVKPPGAFQTHDAVMKRRARAFREDADERMKRLRRMTMAESARAMEALCSFPWPRRKKPAPPIPFPRFVTDDPIPQSQLDDWARSLKVERGRGLVISRWKKLLRMKYRA